jgi:hypothetical protein
VRRLVVPSVSRRERVSRIPTAMMSRPALVPDQVASMGPSSHRPIGIKFRAFQTSGCRAWLVTRSVIRTTAGVLVGVLLVGLTGWLILDPIIALLVAANIIWTGIRLIHETGLGLLDTSLPKGDLNQIHMVLEPYRAQGILFHALRSRAAGTRRFVSFHVLVPGSWTVLKGHALCEEIELAIRHTLPETTVFTHLEPREDPVSFSDQTLDRDPLTVWPCPCAGEGQGC